MAARGQGQQGRHWDPDYHQWRNEQMRNLDNDYDEWRRHYYQRFSEDFNNWPSSGGRKGGGSSGSNE